MKNFILNLFLTISFFSQALMNTIFTLNVFDEITQLDKTTQDKELLTHQKIAASICINFINKHHLKNAKSTNPELYKAFLQIKEDLGIKEDIKLNIFSQKTGQISTRYERTNGIVFQGISIVFLNERVLKYPKEQIIFAMIHELAHIKQFLKHPDIYGGNIDKDEDPYGLDSRKQECSADACAAGYFNCYECLKTTSLYKDPSNPVNTNSGYFSTPKGYFSEQDILLYYERAKEEGNLCDAHKYQMKNPSYKNFLLKDNFLRLINTYKDKNAFQQNLLKEEGSADAYTAKCFDYCL